MRKFISPAWVRALLPCALGSGALFAPAAGVAAQTWGGSIGLTSDYLVRGISRNTHEAAIQADLHVASDSGLLGGVFASTTRFNGDDTRDVEFEAFIGFAWAERGPWRTKILASHYEYPWNGSGSQYNHDELDLDVTYGEALGVALSYSPNSPHSVDFVGLTGVPAKSVEIDWNTARRHDITGSAGVGYSIIGGPGGAGYAYWSLGAAYDVEHWTLSVAYVGTNAAARYLYYDAAAHGRLMATIICKF